MADLAADPGFTAMKLLLNHKLLPSLLAINALFLGAILLSLLTGGRDFVPSAFAQNLPPAPSRDLEVVPAQMSNSTWGCYIVDKRNNTICVYQYVPGERMLRFQAARGFAQDLEMTNYNTSPEPAEIRGLLDKERKAPPVGQK